MKSSYPSSYKVSFALAFILEILINSISTEKVPIMLAEIWRHGARAAAYNSL